MSGCYSSATAGRNVALRIHSLREAIR